MHISVYNLPAENANDMLKSDVDSSDNCHVFIEVSIYIFVFIVNFINVLSINII
jgi:hypothetical protein